jgi:hypothetical protein
MMSEIKFHMLSKFHIQTLLSLVIYHIWINEWTEHCCHETKFWHLVQKIELHLYNVTCKVKKKKSK